MMVKADSADVTTYFVLRLAADGTELTGATITDMDLQYVRAGAAPSAKVDATALAATDSAHADNKAIEIDGTDQPGLYRVDWPDAAFAAGVKEVILSVKYATAFTEHLRVELSPSVDVVALSGDTAAADNAESFFDGTGYAGTNNVIPTVTDVTNAVSAAVTSLGSNVITTASITDGAITEAKVADDVNVNVKTITNGAIAAASFAAGALDAVWLTATRTLTGFGTLAADAATAVWGAVVRTLTATSAPADMATESTLTAIKGAGWAAGTDTLEHIRDAIPAAAPSVGEIRTELEGAGTHLTLIKAATDGLNFSGADVKATLDSEGVAVTSIGNNVITTASITDGAITNAKIADDVDVNVKTFTADAITSAAIAAGAVTELQAGLAREASVAALNDLSSADAQAAAEAALTAYDPPTRTEATADKEAVIAALPGEPPSAATIAGAVLDEPVGVHTGLIATNLDARVSEVEASVDLTPVTDVLTAIQGVGWSDETLVAIQAAIDDMGAGSGASADEIWNELLAGHTTEGSTGAALTAIHDAITEVYGEGALLKTFTSTDSATGLALPGVLVTCWRDAALTLQNGGTQVSDAEGKTRWLCVPGETCYFAQQLTGYAFEIEEEVA